MDDPFLETSSISIGEEDVGTRQALLSIVHKDCGCFEDQMGARPDAAVHLRKECEVGRMRDDGSSDLTQ